MATAQTWILKALRKCGQMRPGYTPSPELLADGLGECQDMYDAFNAQRTMQYTRPDFIFPVTGPGHGKTGNNQTFGGTGYEIGPSAADFVIGFRPEAICRANLYQTTASPTNPTRLPLRQISMDEWVSIAAPIITPTNVTTIFAYDPQFPNGVIWVWPPLNGNSLEIFTWGFLTPPAALGTTMNLPVGYVDAVVFTLAQRLWPMCTKQMMVNQVSLQYLAGQAKIARDRVKAVNAPSPRLTNDFSGARGSVGVGTCDWSLLFTGVPY